MLRAPFLPITEIVASSAEATDTNSADGSRWHSEPPSVPRLRVCRWPTCRTVAFADMAQTVDPVEVDHMIRQHEAHVEHRHQRLAAGEQLGVVETGEQTDDIGGAARIVIGKEWRLHPGRVLFPWVFAL